MTRCQICGRRQGLRKDGAIRFHNVAGMPCAGVGFAPIEQSDARLVEVADLAARAYRETTRELIELYDRRANYIPPELTRRLYEDGRRADRLERRLSHLRAWPRRFVRQMERKGWGDPPPAYLIEREGAVSW